MIDIYDPNYNGATFVVVFPKVYGGTQRIHAGHRPTNSEVSHA